MLHRDFRRMFTAGASLALVGCGVNAQPQESQQGLFLSSVTQSVCTAENGAAPTFEVNIYRDDCTTLVEGPISVGMTELIDVNELQLGTDDSAAGLDGVWVGGDHFQTLAPGDYCVTATPTAGHPGLAPFGTTVAWGTAQNVPVEVPEGGTAETVFAFQCPGDSISALDIVVLVNEGPSITGFSYGPSGKFVVACEPGAFTINWQSPQTDDVTVTCEVFDGEQPDYLFDPATGTGGTAEDTLLAWSDHLAYTPALAGEPYSTTYSPPLAGSGTYWVYCNIENTSGQVTTFQTFLHVSSAPAGYCLTEEGLAGDDFEYGYRTPSPGQVGFLAGNDEKIDGDLYLQGIQAVFPYETIVQDPADPSQAIYTIVPGAFDAVGYVDLYLHETPGGGLDLGTWRFPLKLPSGAPTTGVLPWPDPPYQLSQVLSYDLLQPDGTPTTSKLEFWKVNVELDGLGNVVFRMAPGNVVLENVGDDVDRIFWDVETTIAPYMEAGVGPGTYGLLSCDYGDFIGLNAECSLTLEVDPCEEVCEQDEADPTQP